MAFGTTPTSTTTLGANQFPVSSAASPNTPSGNLTAVAGAPGAYVDSNGNAATAVMVQCAQPWIVQSTNSVTGSGAKTLTASFASSNTKGNSIVVCVGMGEVEGANIVLTITDSNSNTYTKAVSASQSTTLESAVFYAVNVASGSNTITATISGTSSVNAGIALEIYEVYGLIANTPGVLDQTATGNSSGATSVTTAILTPVVPNELIFLALSAAGGTLTAGTGWTLDSGTLSPTGGGVVSFGSESRLYTTLTTFTPSATIGTSNAYAAACASFKSVAVPIAGVVVDYPSAAVVGGSTPYHLMSGSGTNGNSLKATPGQIYGFSISNAAASARYFKLYNLSTTPTVGSSTISMTVQVPANSTVMRAFPVGLNFTAGIAFAVTGGIADADITSISANDLSIDIDYK